MNQDQQQQQQPQQPQPQQPQPQPQQQPQHQAPPHPQFGPNMLLMLNALDRIASQPALFGQFMAIAMGNNPVLPPPIIPVDNDNDFPQHIVAAFNALPDPKGVSLAEFAQIQSGEAIKKSQTYIVAHEASKTHFGKVHVRLCFSWFFDAAIFNRLQASWIKLFEETVGNFIGINDISTSYPSKEASMACFDFARAAMKMAADGNKALPADTVVLLNDGMTKLFTSLATSPRVAFMKENDGFPKSINALIKSGKEKHAEDEKSKRPRVEKEKD